MAAEHQNKFHQEIGFWKNDSLTDDELYEGGGEEEQKESEIEHQNRKFIRSGSEKDLEPATPEIKPMVYSDSLSSSKLRHKKPQSAVAGRRNKRSEKQLATQGYDIENDGQNSNEDNQTECISIDDVTNCSEVEMDTASK